MPNELFEHLPISLGAQIACVENEIKMRERVYARLVQEHKMTQAKADREIATMHAVRDTLKGLLP